MVIDMRGDIMGSPMTELSKMLDKLNPIEDRIGNLVISQKLHNKFEYTSDVLSILMNISDHTERIVTCVTYLSNISGKGVLDDKTRHYISYHIEKMKFSISEISRITHESSEDVLKVVDKINSLTSTESTLPLLFDTIYHNFIPTYFIFIRRILRKL